MARRVEIWVLLGVVGSVELRYLDSGYRFPSLVFADSEALKECRLYRVTHVKHGGDAAAESQCAYRVTLKETDPGGRYENLYVASHAVDHDDTGAAQQILDGLVVETTGAHLVGQLQEQPAKVLCGLAGSLTFELRQVDIAGCDDRYV